MRKVVGDRKSMETLKVAMIGDWTSVVGFKAVGVEPYIAVRPEDGPEVWNSLPRERYGVIIITEPVYEVLRDSIADFLTSEGLPVILPIPAISGSLGIAKAGARKRVEKALGSVIKG